jgi:acyl dehydratase
LAEQTNPNGIFNRSAKGMSTEPVVVSVERHMIRFFAQVLEIEDPIHFDVAAARSAGHPDLVAPPSFFMVIEACADEERRRRKLPSLLELAGADFRYLLHGEERYFYEAPIYAGEEVELTGLVTDFFDKKGGTMEFVSIESRMVHPSRGLLMRGERSLLHRLPNREGN